MKNYFYLLSSIFSLFRESIKIISRRATCESSLIFLLFLFFTFRRLGKLSLSLFLFLAFRRTFLAPPPAPVTAPGQILFPVEFKTPRNTRIYFTGVPRAAGRDEEGRGVARFYSGSNEARKRNKEKMYTPETREATQTRTQGEERRRLAKGVGERVGSSKLLYLGRSPLSERSGRYYFSKTTSSTSNPISSLFFLNSFSSSPSQLLR